MDVSPTPVSTLRFARRAQSHICAASGRARIRPSGLRTIEQKPDANCTESLKRRLAWAPLESGSGQRSTSQPLSIVRMRSPMPDQDCSGNGNRRSNHWYVRGRRHHLRRRRRYGRRWQWRRYGRWRRSISSTALPMSTTTRCWRFPVLAPCRPVRRWRPTGIACMRSARSAWRNRTFFEPRLLAQLQFKPT